MDLITLFLFRNPLVVLYVSAGLLALSLLLVTRPTRWIKIVGVLCFLLMGAGIYAHFRGLLAHFSEPTGVQLRDQRVVYFIGTVEVPYVSKFANLDAAISAFSGFPTKLKSASGYVAFSINEEPYAFQWKDGASFIKLNSGAVLRVEKGGPEAPVSTPSASIIPLK